MSLPEFCTWDGGTGDDGYEPPRRPSTEDVGGDEKVDDQDFPPDAKEHFTSQGWNQKAKQIPALARMTPSGKCKVTFSGSNPGIEQGAGCSSNVSPATFTPTDNGTGDTTVTWPAGTFPPELCSPNALTLYSSSTQPVTGHLQVVTNGVRVRTFVNGVAADVPFSFNIN